MCQIALLTQTLVFAYELRARAKRKWIACKSKYFEAQQIRYKSVNPRTYEPLLLRSAPGHGMFDQEQPEEIQLQRAEERRQSARDRALNEAKQ